MIRVYSSHSELCHYVNIKTQYSADNAWNVNLNNGNVNNNTKSNANSNYRVRAVSDCQYDTRFMLFFRGMLAAYYECRKNKRSSLSEIIYEMNGIQNTLYLAYDIYNHEYRVGPSICFLIYIPTIREVFAANFVDRILHTWIAKRIEPYLEQYLPDCTYSNRKGRGTSGAVNALKKMIDEHQDYWIWKFDLQGFFMSIDKRILWSEFKPFIEARYVDDDLGHLLYAMKAALFNPPQLNCVRMCSKDRWDDLPTNKSLFGNPWWLGLPIGDLLSQMMVGFFLKPFIDYLNSLGFTLISHYVDDFVVLHKNKDHILESIPKIRIWLQENRGITLHPRKSYLQHATKGVRFLGAVMRPNVIFSGARTIKNANEKALPKSLIKARASVNSYLGFFKQFMTYNIRKTLAEKCFKKYGNKIYFGKSYNKMIVCKPKKKHKKKGLKVVLAK